MASVIRGMTLLPMSSKAVSNVFVEAGKRRGEHCQPARQQGFETCIKGQNPHLWQGKDTCGVRLMYLAEHINALVFWKLEDTLSSLKLIPGQCGPCISPAGLAVTSHLQLVLILDASNSKAAKASIDTDTATIAHVNMAFCQAQTKS